MFDEQWSYLAWLAYNPARGLSSIRFYLCCILDDLFSANAYPCGEALMLNHCCVCDRSWVIAIIDASRAFKVGVLRLVNEGFEGIWWIYITASSIVAVLGIRPQVRQTILMWVRFEVRFRNQSEAWTHKGIQCASTNTLLHVE